MAKKKQPKLTRAEIIKDMRWRYKGIYSELEHNAKRWENPEEECHFTTGKMYMPEPNPRMAEFQREGIKRWKKKWRAAAKKVRTSDSPEDIIETWMESPGRRYWGGEPIRPRHIDMSK